MSTRARCSAPCRRALPRCRRSACGSCRDTFAANSSKGWSSIIARSSWPGCSRSAAVFGTGAWRCSSSWCAASADDEALGHIENWLEIAPFDIRAHEHLFEALARRARFRDGDEHLAVSAKLFSAEGLDCAGLRDGVARVDRVPGPVAREPPDRSSEQAYDCYLLGRQHLARMMQRGLEEGRHMFDRAVELEPGYGPAWAGLATVRPTCTSGSTRAKPISRRPSRRADVRWKLRRNSPRRMPRAAWCGHSRSIMTRR